MQPATPLREPDWVGNLHHRTPSDVVRWRVHLWEPEGLPDVHGDHAAMIQVWSMPGFDTPQRVFGIDRMQAMFLAWTVVEQVRKRVDAAAVITGIPGAGWPEPGEELPCFVSSSSAQQDALLERVMRLLGISSDRYRVVETVDGPVLHPRRVDEAQLFARFDAMSAAVVRRLRG